jgi:hypothetical protein
VGVVLESIKNYGRLYAMLMAAQTDDAHTTQVFIYEPADELQWIVEKSPDSLRRDFCIQSPTRLRIQDSGVAL